MTEYSIFDYMYRDAGNYKSWSYLLLKGRTTKKRLDEITACLNDYDFFIAEQVGIPPLYEELWGFSGGPTEDDHVWHTFNELRKARADEIVGEPWGTVAELIARFKSVKRWDEQLSPHWDI